MVLTCLMMVLTCLMMAWWQIIIVCSVIFITVLYVWCSHYERLVVLWAVLRMSCASCYRVGRKHSTRARDSLRWATSQKQQNETSAFVASSDFEQMTAARRLRPELHSERSLSSSLTLPLSVSHALGKTRGLQSKEPTPILFTRDLQHPELRDKTTSGLEGGAPVSSQLVVDGARGALGGLPRTLWSGDSSRSPSLFASAGIHYEHEYACLYSYIQRRDLCPYTKIYI
jgi:hypothetical protein